MRLIEIAKVVDDLGPRPIGRLAASEERLVEPDGAGEEFRRHTDFASKPELELTGAQARSGNQSLDAHVAAPSDHRTGSAADLAIRTGRAQHHAQSALH